MAGTCTVPSLAEGTAPCILAAESLHCGELGPVTFELRWDSKFAKLWEMAICVRIVRIDYKIYLLLHEAIGHHHLLVVPDGCEVWRRHELVLNGCLKD